MTLADETRLANLRASELLDSMPEEQFDRLTKLTSRILGVPVALISLVDDRRQFFKSQFGLAEPWATTRETPLTHSFCQHVVTTARPLVIDDSISDPRVDGNLAISELGVAAYCGVPLRAENGAILGSLCAIDGKARRWTESDVSVLEDLAEIVMTEVQLRSALNKERELRAEKFEVVRTLQSALLPPVLPDIPGIELAAAYLPAGIGAVVGGDFYDVFQGRDENWNILLGDVCGKGVQSARTSLLVRHVMNAAALRSETPSSSFRLVDKALLQHEHPFVALGLLTLETHNGVTARLTLAGQPSAIVLRGATAEVVGAYGMVVGVGVDSGVKYETTEIALGPGDLLVMFTDGVTDSPGQITTERDVAAQLQYQPPITVNEAVDRIVKLAHEMNGVIRTPTDDIAVIAVGVPPEN